MREVLTGDRIKIDAAKMVTKFASIGLQVFRYGRVDAYTDSLTWRLKRQLLFNAAGLITKFEKPAIYNTISKLIAIKKLSG